METKEIELKYNRKDFEEIYFRNGDNRILLNPNLRKDFNIIIVIAAVLTGTSIYYEATGKNAGFVIFLFILISLASIRFYAKATPFITWKSTINSYLNDLEKIKKSKLVLSSNTFSLIQDEKETIEKWSEFKKVEIEPTYLLITGSTTYLIPKKSMKDFEFELFRKIITEKISADNLIKT